MRDEAIFEQAVFNRRLVVYIDEWGNKRTMEARAYGAGRGGRKLLIGFQLDADRGVAPEQLWKSIDDVERVWILEDVYRFQKRVLPAHHTAQIIKFGALSEDTEIDAVPPPTDGYYGFHEDES